MGIPHLHDALHGVLEAVEDLHEAQQAQQIVRRQARASLTVEPARPAAAATGSGAL